MDAFEENPPLDDLQVEITELDPVGKIQERRRNMKFIAGGIVALTVLITISTIVFYVIYWFNPSPTKTLATFCNAIKDNDYQTLSQEFSPSGSPHMSESDLRTAFQAPLARLGGIKDCSVGEVQQSGSQATGVMTWALGNGSTLVFHCQLINKQGGWKVTLLTF